MARKYKSIAFILAAAALVLVAQPAAAQDDDYLTVYSVIEQADSLAANGRTAQAHAKYLEAQRDLTAFKQNNPAWNTQMVSYRLDYVADKIKATSGENVSPADDNNSISSSKPMAAGTGTSPVKLLDAGSEPRKVLRLHPVVGDKQTMTMNLQMSVSGNSIPAMVMTMDSEVKEVSPDGEISYAIVFGSADMVTDKDTPPATAAMMKTALAGLQGVSGSAMMSDRGVVKSMDLKVPPAAGAQLGQTLGQLKDSFSSSSTPLPEEAVGAGAKWEYHTRAKSEGINMDQTVTMELVSVDGDTINLRTTIAQNAANQKIESPAMPGLKVDLTKLTGTGSGTTSLDLNHLMPQTASLDETTETAMSVNIAGKKQDMDMTMRIKIDIQTK